MSRSVDRLVVRAVRHGLHPGTSAEVVGTELVHLARGNRTLLERAVRRIETGLRERPSQAGQRARQVLREALALVEAAGEGGFGERHLRDAPGCGP